MFNLPYRTQRTLKRVGIVLMVLFVLGVTAWLCWVVWLQRYVVYTDMEDGTAGAKLDFSVSANEAIGEEATPPVAEAKVSIFYNEGADAIDTSNELKPLVGYYITSDMFKEDMAGVLLQLERLPAGTAVMIEMKGPYGSFFYPSKLGNATISASTDVQAVSSLVQKLKDKGFYTIAQVSAFRDREFGDKNVTSGLYMLSRAGLWMDPGGMYWLDPTNGSTINWITSVVTELKNMGFNEVLLSNFCFPGTLWMDPGGMYWLDPTNGSTINWITSVVTELKNMGFNEVLLSNFCFPGTDQYIFNGDKPAALKAAADSLLSNCTSADFVLSFEVTDPTFALPDGRCRMYLRNVDPNSIAQKVGQATFDDTDVRLVFLSETGDTRFDALPDGRCRMYLRNVDPNSIAQKVGQATFDDTDVRLVFLSETGDTRFDEYSVLRSLNVSEEVEARKQG